MTAIFLALTLLTSTASRAGAAGWTLVHNEPVSDLGTSQFYWYFGETDGDLFALPGIAVSTDDGRTWTRRASYIDTGLESVVFASPQVAVGSMSPFGDGIWISTNAGRNWDWVRAAPEDPGWPTLLFFDARHGFAFGDGLYSTNDGGRTWTKTTVPNEDGPDPRAVAVLGERAWVADARYPRLKLTTDRGRTWDSVQVPGADDPKALCFSDASRGWLLAGNDRAAGAGLFATTDGGRTWRRLPLDAKATWPLKSLACRDDKTVWAAGPGVMLASEDGGKTWTPMALPPGAKSADDLGIRFVQARDGPVLMLAAGEQKGTRARPANGGSIYRLLLDGKK
jgi:photosystem II stability/assembly factor-like uncharacterized protein